MDPATFACIASNFIGTCQDGRRQNPALLLP